MDNTRTTSDLPPRPMGHGETLVQVFRSAAEQGATDGGEVTPWPRSRPLRSPVTRPSLQRRLFEAEGRPVRFGRYDVVRCVGAGGMGVVYEAIEVAHGHRVALKTLRSMTASGLARFKNEFRSLSGVCHPNLVSLYELGVEDEEWFFTMDLVEGDSFGEHVQNDAHAPGGWAYLGVTLAEDLPSGVHGPEEAIRLTPRATFAEPSGGPALPRRFHEGRLRAALRQLAAAVAALHELGKLHRDLNPGNVLVTREGRVVVLDFGLVCDRVRRPGAPYDGACGTPAYMSPEQAAGKPATPASDWYGVGVMIFEALTGQLPFTGSAGRMLGNKRLHEAPPPSLIASGLPADLEALCVGLLRRSPAERPDAAGVLDVLGVPVRRTRPVEPSPDAFFVGRQVELAALEDARRAAGDGRPVAVVVHGPPGSGKTCLLARFLDEVGARQGAIVLRGTCRAREAIPRRVLDAVVDSLAVYLAAMPDAEARAILPEGVNELARMFPTLEDVRSIGEVAAREPEEGDRRGATAFAEDRLTEEDAALDCLRGLLARLAEARTVVIGIDDAHLADPRGARELARVLAPAGGHGHALVVLAHDDDCLVGSLVIAEVARAFSSAAAGAHGVSGEPVGEVRRIGLDRLAEEDLREVSSRFLPCQLREREAVVAAIGAAARGSPLAAVDLAVHVAETGGRVSMEDAIGARLACLPEHASRLLDVAAVGGASLERALLFDAAGVGPMGEVALATLTATRLLRVVSWSADGMDCVAIYDECVRTVVASRLGTAEARRINLDLGRMMAARPGAAPASVAECYERAGVPELGVSHLGAAAEQAISARDHDGAATLLSRALAHVPRGTAAHRELLTRRADVLARAGRSAEAAEAFLECAAGAPRAEGLALRRRAVEHLMVVGQFDRGIDELNHVLEAHGVHWPEAHRRTVWALRARLLELRLRGASLPERARRGKVASTSASRVESLWSAGKALAMIDPLRSAFFIVDARLTAHAAGDAEHAALAQALFGSLLASQGSAADEAHGLDLIDESARFARRRGDTYLAGLAWFCSGLARLSAGRFREALARMDEAMAMLMERGGDLAWERHAHRVASLHALLELGALRERTRRAEAWLFEARQLADHAGEAQASLAVSLTLLARGDAVGARTAARPAAMSWRGGFGLPQHAAMVVEVSSLLYEGEIAAARARLSDAWPALEASQIVRIQLLRVEALRLRGLTMLATGGIEAQRLARVDAARLAREKRPHALAAAAVLRAGLARLSGEIAVAVGALDEAARGYASAEMRVQAASARRAQGMLLGGREGRAMVAAADELLAAEGVSDGAKWAGMLTGIGR